MNSATASARDPRLQHDWSGLANRIRDWGRALGFDEIGIAGTDLSADESRLVAWLDAGRHGTMDYMARHGVRRARPADLVPGTQTIITARMNYLPPSARPSEEPCWPIRPRDSSRATRSAATTTRCCARSSSGSPTRIREETGDFGYRVFTDSAPVLEVALAANSGLGWRGKHTLLLTARGRLVVLPGRDLHRPAACPRRPAIGALRDVHRMHRRLSDAGDRRALRARRAPLHLVPHDRARRQHSRGTSPADRQSDLRLRRLPARLSLEPVCEHCDRRRIRRSPWAGQRRSRSRCSRGPSRVRRADGGQRDPPDRLRALVAQHRGRRSATRRASRGPRRATSRAGDPSALVREHVAWALARHRGIGV